MRLLKQALAVLGTVVVIAVIAAVVTPKTAHAIVATAVQVVNTTSQPVPMLAADALNAFDVRGTCSFSVTGCEVIPIYSVPAGKIAVIEMVSGACEGLTQPLSRAFVKYSGSGGALSSELWLVPGPSEPWLGGSLIVSVSEDVRGYALGGVTGSDILIVFETAQIQGASCFAEVAGHLVSAQ